MNGTVVKLEGILDVNNIASTARLLEEGLREGSPLEIDPSALSAIDGCSMQLLLATVRTAREKGSRIHWSSDSAPLAEAASLLGLTEELEIREPT